MLIFSPFPSIFKLVLLRGSRKIWCFPPWKNLERWPLEVVLPPRDPIGNPYKNRRPANSRKHQVFLGISSNHWISRRDSDDFCKKRWKHFYKELCLKLYSSLRASTFIEKSKTKLTSYSQPFLSTKLQTGMTIPNSSRQEARMPRSDRPWWELKRFKKEILG